MYQRDPAVQELLPDALKPRFILRLQDRKAQLFDQA
jgi:hypothetical protein